MSLAAFAFRSFRVCTATTSVASLARPGSRRCPTRLSGIGRRQYTEAKSNDDASPVEGSGAEEPSLSGPECAENLKAKEAEVVDLMGRLRYLQADFLNLQRNSAREKEQTRDFAITRFATDLLETVDVLAMALKSVPESALISSGPSDSLPPTPPSKSHMTYLQELHTGVEMTHRLLLQTLFKYHVKPFDPTGDQFDPNLHEALYQAPIPGKEPGTVIECQKIGYKIKDRVLRAAQVGVVQDSS